MIDCEPKIKVALLQKYCESKITLNGNFYLPGGKTVAKFLHVQSSAGKVLLYDNSGKKVASRKKSFLRQTRIQLSLCM